MKFPLLQSLMAAIVLSVPNFVFGQAPPLGAASGFAMFTVGGAFGNVGATMATGDLGTNSGAFTGFPPGALTGLVHVADAVSIQAALDVEAAYISVTAIPCGSSIGLELGGQTLAPGTYCTNAASTLTGNLTLDGQGYPGALFVFKIGGALTTGGSSTVTLVNSASLSNVFWQVNGAAVLAGSSVFRGTMLVDGGISLAEGASLFGRGLSRTGAISLANNVVEVPAIALPVELVSFVAQKQGNAVLLRWETGAENENARVELQKSTDARDFETIEIFDGRAGIPTVHQSFSFLDKTPLPAAGCILYYRLKQFDLDGNFAYLGMATVAIEPDGRAVLSPNPAFDHLALTGITGLSDFSVADFMGKTVLQGQFDPEYGLGIDLLPTGFYCLSVQGQRFPFLKI